MKKPRIRTVDDLAQLKAARSAVRQEIIDTLLACGGQASVAELAAELGRPADGLYYHMKALHKAGLIEEGGQRAGRRGSEAVYRVPGKPQRMQIRYQPESAENVETVSTIADNLLRMTGRDFRRGFTPDLAVVFGKRRNLWITRNKGWLSNSELEEVNALLNRLIELFNKPRSEERKHLCALTTALVPIEAQAVRRNDTQNGKKQTD